MAKFVQFFWGTTAPFQKKGYGAAFQLKFHASCAAVTRGFAARCERYMKDHAPWDDRTGSARDGLTAQGEFSFIEYTVVLFHTVDYGIWLEIRWNGKYAIIQPTIEAMGPQFMAEMVAAEVLAGAI